MENILTTQGIKQAFPIGSGREFVALHDINIQIPKGNLRCSADVPDPVKRR